MSGAILTEARRAPLAFALLAVILTWPAAILGTSGITSNVGGDGYDHLWGYWWVADHVARTGRIPFWTDLLGFPVGGRLYFIDILGAVLMLPFGTHPKALYLAYNVFQIVQVTLAGWLTWRLCRREGAGEAGAMVGGVIFAASTTLQATLYDGVVEMGNAFVLPLALTLTLDVLDGARDRRVLGLGLTLALGALASWYYGMFLVICVGTAALWRVLVVPRRGAASPRALARFVGAGALSLVLVAPFILRFFSTVSRPDALIERADLRTSSPDSLIAACNDLVLGLVPGLSGNLNIGGSTFLHTAFPGLLAMLLALGLALSPLWRGGMGGWALMTAAGWILSFGPRLVVLRRPAVGVPLPWDTVTDLLPFLTQINFPYRFAVISQLGLAVLAARAATGLGSTLGRRWRVLVPALAALVAVEQVATGSVDWPRPISSIPEPTYAAALQGGDPERAVLDLPYPQDALMHQLCIAHYTWDQMWVHRPIPFRVNFTNPTSAIADTDFVSRLERMSKATVDRWSLIDIAATKKDLWELSEQGFGWIVFHGDLYARHPDMDERARGESLRSLLKACCKQVASTGDVDVYEIPAPRRSRHSRQTGIGP